MSTYELPVLQRRDFPLTSFAYMSNRTTKNENEIYGITINFL